MKKFVRYPKNYVACGTQESGSSNWYDRMREELLQGKIIGTLAYDSDYADEINIIYGEVLDVLKADYPDLDTESSIQAGRGSVEAWYTSDDGDTISGSWDFEDECDNIEEAVRDSVTVDEFRIELQGIIGGYLSQITDEYYYELDQSEDDEY